MQTVTRRRIELVVVGMSIWLQKVIHRHCEVLGHNVTADNVRRREIR